MSLEENKSIVAEFYSKLCTVDAQEAFDLMAEDADWTMVAKSSIAPLGAVTKQTFIKEMLSTGGSLHPDRNPASVFPDGLELTIKSLTAEGDHVVLEGESYAIAANGNIYNNTYSYHFDIRDGKIQSVREYSDTHHGLTSVGDLMHLKH
ncbi:nuclear transport factor 2 family protein [Nocardia fusca]|uniref:nuclear transport factor 2 family protein n=1 Tax=Nocardia fusca TaxID=941183 RepID=UPI003790DD52